MADFDMPGIGKARIGADGAGEVSGRRGGCSKVKYELVRELYTEIRAARLAGHSWEVIKNSIRGSVDVRISVKSLAAFFAEIDKHYEAETALRRCLRRGRSVSGGRPKEVRFYAGGRKRRITERRIC